MTLHKGFSIVCHDCLSKSELNSSDDRLTKDVKLLNHIGGIRLVCIKCDQQLVMS